VAQPIPCDICEQTVADWVITDQRDGSVIGLGIECLLDWAVPIAEAFNAAQEREPAGPDSSPGSAQTGDDEWEASARVAAPKSDEASGTVGDEVDKEADDTAETADVES